jgi:hypothetical protein
MRHVVHYELVVDPSLKSKGQEVCDLNEGRPVDLVQKL